MTRSLLLLIITAFISVSACGEIDRRLGASGLPSTSGVCARITTSVGGHVLDRAPQVEGSCYPFAPGSVAEYAMQ